MLGPCILDFYLKGIKRGVSCVELTSEVLMVRAAGHQLKAI